MICSVRSAICQAVNATATATVHVTINPVNDPPTIAGVPDQTINEDSATAPVLFAVADIDSPIDSLTLSGASFDPTSGIMYVNSNNLPYVLQLTKNPEGSEFPYKFMGYTHFVDKDNHPAIKPPWGLLTAIDLNKGDVVWQIAHGETPDNVRNNPALKGLTIPRTGQSGAVGALVTKTLVVAGDPIATTGANRPRGAMLRAYDKATGKEVGAVLMPAQQSGTPMTYALNGKQYIVVAVSGGNYSGEYLAFALGRQ